MQTNPREARTLSQMRRQKEMRRKYARNRIIMLVAFFVVSTTVLSFSFVAFFQSGFLVGEGEQPNSDINSDATDSETVAPEDADGDSDPSVIAQFELPSDIQKTINTAGMITPSSRMLAVQENGVVDMSYFNDAVFIGDSLAQGFVDVYDTFPNSGSVAVKSMSSDGFVTKTIDDGAGNLVLPVDLVAQKNPRKIYILIGVNDLVWMSDDQMVASFSMLVDALAERVPSAQIYLMSVPPQTASRGTDDRYSVVRINGLNDRLAVMAREKGIFYLDLHEILADDAGNLYEDIAAADGFHLTPQGYIKIREYLQSHTVHAPGNPYLEGSPLYNIEDPSILPEATEVAQTPAE